MPRGPRLDAPGILHPVMTRGVDRQRLFRDDPDRNNFVQRRAVLATAAAWTVSAWILIPKSSVSQESVAPSDDRHSKEAYVMIRDLLQKCGALIERRRMKDPVYRLLRYEIEIIAKDYEAMSYDDLIRSSEELSRIKVVDGVNILFTAEAREIERNGDLCFCIDARTEPRRLGLQPFYQFFKRKGGSVYY